MKIVKFLVPFIILSLKVSIFACECNFPSVCAAYSKAKKIFIGRLDKIVPDQTESVYTIKAYFSPEKSYKGKTTNLEIITFKLGGCSSVKFVEGEKYFVYAEEKNLNTYCNRTVSLSEAKNDLEYVNSISEKTPIYSINGFLNGVDINELKNVKVTIKTNRKSYKVLLDKNGLFDFTGKIDHKYHVKILIPYKARIEVTNYYLVLTNTVKITHNPSTTAIEYDLDIKPNECDFRQIDVSVL